MEQHMFRNSTCLFCELVIPMLIPDVEYNDESLNPTFRSLCYQFLQSGL